MTKTDVLALGGGLEAGRDSLAERFQRGREPERLVEPVGLAAEPPLLLGERRVSDPDLGATTLILGERDDAAQVGLGQPLELLGQRRLPLAQPLPSRLEFLRVPGADRRESEGLRHGRRVPQQITEVLPDQIIDGPGWDVPALAGRPVAMPGRPRLARADVVAVPRR
jgi:hypothetical protein